MSTVPNKNIFIDSHHLPEFGGSLKNDVINGKEIDNRTELLLSDLFGTEGYNRIIQSRYDNSNAKVTKWNLGFLPHNQDKQRQSLRQYRIGDYILDPIFDFEISEFISNRVTYLSTLRLPEFRWQFIN